MPPSDAVVAITHRCNGRCLMCNVWRSKAEDVLAPGHIAKLPGSLKTVNITGGEPFLHSELSGFVAAVRRHMPGATTTISTNGLLSDRVGELLPELLSADSRLRIAVSIDGLAENHDRIRGREGAFARAMETIKLLKKAKFKGLRLGMTLSEANSDQLLAVAELAREYEAELSVVPAHASAVHFRNEQCAPAEGEVVLPQLEVMVDQLLRSFRPKLWLRGHFADRIGQYLSGRLRRFPCSAGDDFFFLQADGNVYPCNVCSEPWGNIIEDDFDSIWNSAKAELARQSISRCERGCWMVCTARGYYRTHKFEVLSWIVAHKLQAHVRNLFGRARRE